MSGEVESIMPFYADLAVYNRHGRLIALVEIKNKSGTSRTWATGLRHNRLAHGEDPQADFFLLVTPDTLYLWKNAAPCLDEPTYVIDAQPLFAPYYARAGMEGRVRSRYAFELLVAGWLSDLLRADIPLEQLANGQQWLITSGFFQAVRDGHIVDDAVRV